MRIQKERQTTTLLLVKQVTGLLSRTRLQITVTCQFLHAKNARHMLIGRFFPYFFGYWAKLTYSRFNRLFGTYYGNSRLPRIGQTSRVRSRPLAVILSNTSLVSSWVPLRIISSKSLPFPSWQVFCRRQIMIMLISLLGGSSTSSPTPSEDQSCQPPTLTPC